MRELTKKLALVLGALLLMSPALAQQSAGANVKIWWKVADSITAGGTVNVRFEDEIDNGAFDGTVQGRHNLTYANNQTGSRRITIEASVPTGLVLTANATPATGTGTAAATVTVGSSAQNLITSIPGGTVNGTADVIFEAEASGPIADTTITITYTITAGQ